MEKAHPLSLYSPSEKLAYLSIVASMAAADGEFASEERESLRALCNDVRLREDDVLQVMGAAEHPEMAPVEQYVSLLATSELRFTLMTDLLFMAYADHVVTPEEEQEISRLAGRFSLDEKQLNGLRTYVEAVTSLKDGKNSSDVLTNELKSRFQSLDIPLGAVLLAGGALGYSGLAAGILTAGAIGIGSGLAAAVALGFGTIQGVRWLYEKTAENGELKS
jgi:uncharacterized tellurite resistance protein B-like protein